jgi:hypothetical protein
MSKQDDFIAAIAPIARAEYINRDRWVLPSVCIAQAALESGWNVKAKTLFGIKGRGSSLKTVEYINGKYVDTTASFKAYPSLAAAVHGYYDLITGNARYSGAVNNTNFRNAIQAIKNGGYATDPNYVNKIVSIINQYNLTKYDVRVTKLSNEEVANKVIRGEYGNGSDRENRLRSDGYDPATIQGIVNEKLGVSTVNIDDIARRVIRGEFGNGAVRKAKLNAIGVDANAVQERVNKLMKRR